MSSAGVRVSAGAAGAVDADAEGEGVGDVEVDEDATAGFEVGCADRADRSSEQPVAVVQTRKAAVMNPVRMRSTSLSSRRCQRAKARRAAGEYPPVPAMPISAVAWVRHDRTEE